MEIDTASAVAPPVPDANVAPTTEQADADVQKTGNEADSSPAVPDTDDFTKAAKGLSKRVDELTRNWREEQRRSQELMALLQQRQESKPEAPAETPKPRTLADFDYDEAKYQSHLFEQAEQRAVAAAEKRLKTEQDREVAHRRKSAFAQRETDFAKDLEDYHEIKMDQTLPISPAMADTIEESDEGPALIYFLGKNRGVAAKIAQLSPLGAAREIGRIEERLQNERKAAKEAKSVVTKAPPPAPKIEGSHAVIDASPDSPESDKLSIEDWVKKRNKQLARRK